jgi:uncharacterized OB-fold protein
VTASNRGLPIPTPDSAQFWRGCHDGALRMQRCDDCGELNWFPRGMCVNCSSSRLTWTTLSGRGTLYSFSVVTRPPNDDFPTRYVLALVDLEEGPRMMTHLVDVEPDAVGIGMAVTVRFDRRTDAISLPMFAPVL